MTFLRDSQSGKVVVKAHTGRWGALNDELHVKQ